MQLTFFGATGTVTGSRYLVRSGGGTVLIDCGLFQGPKALRLRNWQPPAFDPARLDAVALTHAHLDHSGYLPLLVRNGFRGSVYCTRATFDLCKLLLPDSGYLQEQQAEYANRRGFSRHKPALPLYTADDAVRALRHFMPLDYDEPTTLGRAASVRFLPAGHILGASIVEFKSEPEGRRAVFSGDLGRMGDPVMREPTRISHADYLVVESTYGNRLHPQLDPEQELAGHLERATGRGGVAVVPTFAVGRAQTLLHLIARIKARGGLRDVPVYLNSPMAIDATRIFERYRTEHRLTEDECREACSVAVMVNTPQESIALNQKRGPMIILSASGMATGGRVLHHLEAFAPDPKNLILFAGFQAAGTRGAAMIAGAESVKIHGQYVPVRAEVVNLSSLSAHADYAGILEWLRGFEHAPQRIFITHGEPAASDELRRRIAETLGWECEVPEYHQSEELP
ncbi:MAG: MBL fold metallo-hydrolase [Betaproteobacteria bacterium]